MPLFVNNYHDGRAHQLICQESFEVIKMLGMNEPIKIRKSLVVIAFISILFVVIFSWATPAAILFACFTLTYTFPLFIWLDRLEPEPRAMRWNAFLWGAGVSVIVASVFNDVTTVFFGLTVAAVLSAPLVEETMKALGVLFAAKQLQVDSPLDGAIYAGYIGLGFATVENVIYFSEAISENNLSMTFISRGLFSPLAHPYFTLFAGLFIGKAVLTGASRRVAALKGLLIGIPLHAIWNGMTIYSPLVFLLIGHIALFIVMVVKLVRMRRREIEFVRSHISQLAFTHNLSPVELETFGDLKATRQLRRKLSRQDRQSFDVRQTQINRLALKIER